GGEPGAPRRIESAHPHRHLGRKGVVPMLRTFLVCTALAITIAPAAGARDKPHPWDMHRQQLKSPGGGCPPGLEGRRWDCPPDRPGLRDTRRRPFELRRAEPAPLHPFERRYGR